MNHSYSFPGIYPHSSLTYAFCEFASALCSNGQKLEPEGRKKLIHILTEDFIENKDLIHYVLGKEAMDVRIAYLWVFREMDHASGSFRNSQKEKFKKVIHCILDSFPVINHVNYKMGEKFLAELDSIS